MNKRPSRIKQLQKEQQKTQRKKLQKTKKQKPNSPAERLLEVRRVYLSHLPLPFIIDLYISIKIENTDNIF